MGNYYTPYATLPFAYGREDAVDVFRSAVRQLIAGVDKLQLGPVAPDDQLMRFLAAPTTGIAVVTDLATVNWFHRVDSVESYYAQLDSTLRSTIERKQRALERHGQAVYQIVADPEEIESVMHEYFEVYAHSWKPPEPYPDFIRGFMRIAARAGLLRLGILKVNDRPVAAQIWLVRNHTAYIYKLAYVEELARSSVGTLLTWHIMQNVVRNDGVTCFDYLTGNDAYKEQWMKSSRALSRVTFVNRSRPFGLLFYLRNRIRRNDFISAA